MKCFDKTTALCLLKAWFIDIYSSTCCVRNKLLSYFSRLLQILKIFRKIRETLKLRGKEMAVNMFQSFPAVRAKVPSGPCPCLSTISSLLLLQTWPWILSHTEQNNTGMKIYKKPFYHQKSKFLITFYWLVSTLQASILVIVTVGRLGSLWAAFPSRSRLGKRRSMPKDKTGQDRQKPTQSSIPAKLFYNSVWAVNKRIWFGFFLITYFSIW